MSFIRTKSGINWHYETKGQGEPLVFLHGWSVDGRIWRQQVKYFSKTFAVYSFDLPGHGQSSWQEISLKEMALDLLNIFETLQLEKITLIGSSLGGLLAIKLFELDSSRFKRMVLAGSLPKFVPSLDYPAGLETSYILKLAEMLKSDYPTMVHIFFRSVFTPKERSTRRFKWIQRFRQMDDVPQKESLLYLLNILREEDVREIFKGISIPLQFINGTEDYICSLKSIEYLKQNQPQARFDSFENCGHFPFLSKPYEFNAVLENFLKEN